jgi:serine protease Do
MKGWKVPVGIAALTAAGALAAAFAPVAHGQAPPVAVRALEVLGGRGSQIGVSIRDIDPAQGKTDGKAAQAGVVVEDVTPDGPAQKAGIKNGDVITEFDGERVRSVRQFTRLVQETPPGRAVATTLTREGQKVTVTVEPRETNGFTYFSGDRLDALQDFARDFGGNLPVVPAPPRPPSGPTPPDPPAFPDFQSYVRRPGNSLGITISELTPQLAAHFGATDGVLVASVLDGSPGAKAGIKAADVITSINGSDVADQSELRRRIQRMQDGDEFTIGIVRDKKPQTLKGKMETARSRRTYRSDA